MTFNQHSLTPDISLWSISCNILCLGHIFVIRPTSSIQNLSIYCRYIVDMDGRYGIVMKPFSAYRQCDCGLIKVRHRSLDADKFRCHSVSARNVCAYREWSTTNFYSLECLLPSFRLFRLNSATPCILKKTQENQIIRGNQIMIAGKKKYGV